MLKTAGFTAAIAFLIISSPAYCLGLGELRIHSALGQPLEADIALTGVPAGQLDRLNASIPPEAVFEQHGLKRLPVVNRIHVTLVSNHGRPSIHLSTKTGVRQAFLDLLIRVESAQGSTTREFTALLNPPGFGETPTLSARATPAPRSTQPSGQTSRTPARPALQPSSAHSASVATGRDTGDGLPESYGPVRQGQTLWSVARSLHPIDHGVTVPQMVMGIYTHNPEAFRGGINGLLAGSVLRIPGLHAIAAIDPAQARSAIKRQIAEAVEHHQQPSPKPHSAGSDGHPEPGAASVSRDDETDAQDAAPAAAGPATEPGAASVSKDDEKDAEPPAPDAEEPGQSPDALNAGRTRPAVIPAAALAALTAKARASTGNPFQMMPLPPRPVASESVADRTDSTTADAPAGDTAAASSAARPVSNDHDERSVTGDGGEAPTNAPAARPDMQRAASLETPGTTAPASVDATEAGAADHAQAPASTEASAIGQPGG